LGEEPLSVVVGCGHPAFPAGQIRFADLAGHRWVRYPASMPLGEFIQRELDLAGVSEGGGAISTASTFVTVALLQENDDLVSILPAGVAEMFSRKGMLRIVPVKFESRSQTFGIVTRRGPLSAMAEQFVEILTG
jgi:DNA-binding transcriptional LysR family regulator